MTKRTKEGIIQVYITGWQRGAGAKSDPPADTPECVREQAKHTKMTQKELMREYLLGFAAGITAWRRELKSVRTHLDYQQ